MSEIVCPFVLFPCKPCSPRGHRDAGEGPAEGNHGGQRPGARVPSEELEEAGLI